jgi:hypothetical protein
MCLHSCMTTPALYRSLPGFTFSLDTILAMSKYTKLEAHWPIREMRGAIPVKVLVERINAALAGWVNYFRVRNSSRAFSEVCDYVEMKVRTLLTRRKRRRKRSVGWRRWSNVYLYDVLGLYWAWTIHPLPSPEALT